MEQIPFISSAPNTLGIELELQVDRLIGGAGCQRAVGADRVVPGHRLLERHHPVWEGRRGERLFGRIEHRNRVAASESRCLMRQAARVRVGVGSVH